MVERPPARIHGRHGSLAIGLPLQVWLCLRLTLLPVIGALYVLETFSVILQVASYRLFQRCGYFEWRRYITTSISRLAGNHGSDSDVDINGIFVAFALGAFYADFISIDSAGFIIRMYLP